MFDAAALLPWLRAALPDLQAVYVFGSEAQGTATPSSDLDVAVLVPGYADPAALWSLGADLAATLNREVDLVDLRAASTVFQAQILDHGRRLWAAHPAETDAYECFLLGEKRRLDEARAPLVNDFQRTGQLYGG